MELREVLPFLFFLSTIANFILVLLVFRLRMQNHLAEERIRQLEIQREAESIVAATKDDDV